MINQTIDIYILFIRIKNKKKNKNKKEVSGKSTILYFPEKIL